MNKELEEAKKNMKMFIDGKDMSCVSAKDMKLVLNELENSIPKQVIKEKIKEYEKEGFEYENKISTMYYKKQQEIDTLQELLERK